MTPLHEDLQAVEAELETGEAELLRLNVKLAGLRAQRDALLQAIAAEEQASSPAAAPPDLLRLTRGAAIVAVLEAAPEPLHIREIVDALVSAGRPTKYDGVSVDLTTLVQAGRVKRMGRGVYSMP